MNLKAIVRTYVMQIRPLTQAELNWFRQQPTLDSAIEYAGLALNSNGKRYSHQRRLQKVTLEQAKTILLSGSKLIQQSKNFDELHTLVDKLLDPVSGIGELYIYDTALRIGAYLNLLPTKIYLHRGTREGARALGFDGKQRVLDISTIPTELQKLEPHEIEDVLCIFKDDLRKVEIEFAGEKLLKRSWCC